MSPVATILETCPDLTNDQAEAIIAALFPRLVDAQCVADTFGMSRDWVYDNAAELGARVLGKGKYARKRFHLSEAKAAFDGMALVEAAPEVPEEESESKHREPRKPHSSTELGLTKSGNPLLPLPA
jgi:hypothetical protein